MCNPDFYQELAIAAETARYDTFAFQDSIRYPKKAEIKYAYNDDRSREFPEDVPFLDSFVLIPWIAAVVKK
jgi:alkanesulfonate monooxygenase SsuD/methylene tetrahydromethanopterin reductase-like flavin-dependent oxidoreductase (luciferase family)